MRLLRPHLSRLRQHWVLVALCLIYLLLSLLHLRRPGLQYDEVLFANGALGTVDPGLFIEYEWTLGCLHFPVMLMPYIGALKAYLFAPIFAIWTPSALTVRLPVVLVGLAILIVTYLFTTRAFDRRTGLLAALLLGTDPSYIFHVRLDWGPVALMMLCKMGSLYCLAEFVHTRRSSYLKAGALLLGLGVYDKTNFLWFLFALPLAALLVWRKKLLPFFTRPNLQHAAGFFLIGCSPFIFYNWVSGAKTFQGQLGEQQPLLEASYHKSRLTWYTLGGTAVYALVNGDEPPPLGGNSSQTALPVVLLRSMIPAGTWFPWAFAGAAVIFLLVLLMRRPFPGKESVTFIVLLGMLIQLQMFLTHKATGSHHIMMLYPFFHLLTAWAFSLLLFRARDVFSLQPAFGRILGYGAACVLSLVVVSNLVLDVRYIESFRKFGGTGLWSDAIYHLRDYVMQHSDQTYVLMDWGFNNQLLLLTGGKSKRVDLSGDFGDSQVDGEPDPADRLLRWTWNPAHLFVFHSAEHTAEKKPREVFSQMLLKHSLQVETVKVFPQRDGKVAYYLQRVVHIPESVRDKGYLVFREAETFDSKSGGEIDQKKFASQNKALGMFWGRNQADFAFYEFLCPTLVSSSVLDLRVAFVGNQPQMYNIMIDGQEVQTAVLHPTGGYGDAEQDWQLVSVPLGIKMEEGMHGLVIRPVESNSVINIDFLALREQ